MARIGEERLQIYRLKEQREMFDRRVGRVGEAGRLTERPFLFLLHESSVQQKSGRLRIDLDEMTLEIRFAGGMIEEVSSGFVRGIDLISLLEKAGVLGPGGRRAAIEHLARGHHRVGRHLVEGGYLEQGNLWRILQQQATIKLARALKEKEGDFRFEQEPGDAEEVPSWDVDAILLRAIESGLTPGQMRRHLHPFEGKSVLQTSAFQIPASLPLTAEERAFLAAAKGPLRLAALLKAPDFDLPVSRRYQLLLYLYATGKIRFESPTARWREGGHPASLLARRRADAAAGTEDPLVGGRKRFTREEVIALARKGSSLEDADLSGLDLSGLDLSHAHLAGVNLHKANLRNTRLHKANLMRANLSGANLYNADLSHANLSRALFHRAHLVKTKFDGANLDKAVFEDIRSYLQD